MLSQVRKIGNSAGAIIPMPLLKALNLVEGSQIVIEEKNGQIIISPAKNKPKYQLHELLARCDLNAPSLTTKEASEWESMPSVGEEF